MNTNPWNAALEEQDAAQRQEMYDSVAGDQRSVEDEMEEVDSRHRQQQSMMQLDLNNMIASAVKRSGGGMLPEHIRSFINTKMSEKYGLNWDGVSSGVLGGSGFQKDGRFVFNIGNGTDQQGNPQVQQIPFDKAGIFRMAQLNRVAFSDEDRLALRNALIKSGMSEKQVASMEFDPFPGAVERSLGLKGGGRKPQNVDPESLKARMRRGGGAGGREVGSVTIGDGGPKDAPASMVLTPEGWKPTSDRTARPGPRPRFISQDDIEGRPYKDPNRPGVRYHGHGIESFSTLDWKEDREDQRFPNGRWKVVMSGPRLVKDAYVDANGKRIEAQYENGRMYENSKTGDTVFVRDGETPPWLKQAPTGKGRSAEDQIAIDAAKHGNKMEELRLQEGGKNTRSAAKRDFDQKKLDATIKKWDADLKLKERKAKTEEEKAAVAKERARYNDYSKRIGVLTNAANSPYFDEEVKDAIRRKIVNAVNEDDTPNYEALAGTDNQAPIKPGDNTGDETQIPEFDPNKKDYKAGDHFVRNGIEYEVGSDGQPHKVSK